MVRRKNVELKLGASRGQALFFVICAYAKSRAIARVNLKLLMRVPAVFLGHCSWPILTTESL